MWSIEAMQILFPDWHVDSRNLSWSWTSFNVSILLSMKPWVIAGWPSLMLWTRLWQGRVRSSVDCFFNSLRISWTFNDSWNLRSGVPSLSSNSRLFSYISVNRDSTSSWSVEHSDSVLVRFIVFFFLSGFSFFSLSSSFDPIITKLRDCIWLFF